MKDKQFVRLRGSFSNSVAQAYLLLFQGILLTFANFNKFLQTEEALIHCCHDEMQKIRNNLAIKSRKSEVFQKVKENKLLLSKLGANLQNQTRRELKCRNSHAKFARATFGPRVHQFVITILYMRLTKPHDNILKNGFLPMNQCV